MNPAFVSWMLGFPEVNGEHWTAGEKRTAQLRMLGNSVQVQCGQVMGEILMESYLADR